MPHFNYYKMHSTNAVVVSPVLKLYQDLHINIVNLVISFDVKPSNTDYFSLHLNFITSNFKKFVTDLTFHNADQ